MASLETAMSRLFSRHWLASVRRFIHWLSRPHVILSLIMFVLMYYMIIIPLYRMLETTLTWQMRDVATRSEEHTSELQSRLHLVCRLLLEKKKIKTIYF